MNRYKKTRYILRSLGVVSFFLSSPATHGMTNRLQTIKRALVTISTSWSTQPASCTPPSPSASISGTVATCPTIDRSAVAALVLDPEIVSLSKLSASEQAKIIQTHPEFLDRLVSALSHEKTVAFLEELSKEDKDLSTLHLPHGATLEKFSTSVLQKGSSELRDRFAYYYWNSIPKEKRSEWLKSLKEEKYNPLAEYQAKGPVFSKAKDFERALVTRLTAPSIAPNFEALLPNILDHVAHEYDQGRFVSFHARSASWMMLERIYHALYNLTHEKKAPDDFIHLRFRDHSTLTEGELKRIQNYGEKYNFENLLFTNLLLFKDESPTGLAMSRDSWLFATKGMDESEKRLREENPSWIITSIQKMFIDAGMAKEYTELIAQKPHLFEELKKLFEEAVKEQGNHGQLLVLSMPKAIARESVYYADCYGKKRNSFLDQYSDRPKLAFFVANLLSKGLPLGHDPVSDAKNIHKLCGWSTEWCTILRDELINPEAAEKAGVKIVGFDPAVYQRTSKYLKFEEKLGEIMKDIEKIHNGNPL